MDPIFHFFFKWWKRGQPKYELDFRGLQAFVLIWSALWTMLTVYVFFR